MRRSPSRRSTPPPPRISRRSPGNFRPRGKSPERRRRMPPPPSSSGPPKYPPGGNREGSPSRPRERREFRSSPRREDYELEQMIRPSEHPDFHLHRRSRSPLQREPRTRSFSPGKRKMSPKRERERVRGDRERMRSRESERERERVPRQTPLPPPRKRTRSKSPKSVSMGYGGPPEVSPAKSYQALQAQAGPSSEADISSRGVKTFSERFHGTGSSLLKRESDLPIFRGPESSLGDRSEISNITMVVPYFRKQVSSENIVRSIIDPDKITCVRKVGEGSRPIFDREEIIQASRVNVAQPAVEERRVVAIVSEPPIQAQGSMTYAREISQARDNGVYPRRYSPVPAIPGSSRFGSPPRYSESRPRSRDGYYPSADRDLPSRDYPRSSRDYERGSSPKFEPRERSRDDRFERRSDDLRHELELRRRDDRYSSQEGRKYDRSMEYRGGDSDRESSHHRMMIEHRPPSMDRERSRERHGRMIQPSPPGSERRRGPGGDGFGRPMGEGSGNGRMIHHGGPDSRQRGSPERFEDEPPEFQNQRPFRYNKSWDSNPEHVPKGRSYFEHDNRDNDSPYRGRGRGMMRGNNMRGNMRGNIRGRGMMRGRPFRGGAPMRNFRGRGYRPRGFFHAY